ncbi:hypothetical protein GCM10028807_37720 [Spirosoma daeguense]
MTNLLFPTDFSDHTNAALDWVRLFAKKTGATITVVHIQQPVIPDTTLPNLGEPGLGTLAVQEIEEISRQQLEKLVTELQTDGLSVTTDWRIDSVEDGILDAAQEHSADLIVMGRSDLSTFFARLGGTAVTDVADGARCPVLIVPTSDEGKAVRPAQVKTIAYAMQAQTTQDEVTTQTESLVKLFDAYLTVLTEEQLETVKADLIVMQMYPGGGFLDELFRPNHVAKLIEKSEVPVLVYHKQE